MRRRKAGIQRSADRSDTRGGGKEDLVRNGDGGLVVDDFFDSVSIFRAVDLHQIDSERDGRTFSQIVQDGSNEGVPFTGIEGGAAAAVEAATAGFDLDKDEQRASIGICGFHDEVDFVALDANASSEGPVSLSDQVLFRLPFAPKPLFFGMAFG